MLLLRPASAVFRWEVEADGSVCFCRQPPALEVPAAPHRDRGRRGGHVVCGLLLGALEVAGAAGSRPGRRPSHRPGPDREAPGARFGAAGGVEALVKGHALLGWGAAALVLAAAGGIRLRAHPTGDRRVMGFIVGRERASLVWM